MPGGETHNNVTDAMIDVDSSVDEDLLAYLRDNPYALYQGGATAPALDFKTKKTVSFNSDLTPAQITADQNDYSPTGLSSALRLRLDTDASRALTGLAGGASGRILVIANIGANDLVLNDEDANSSAGNRLHLEGSSNITISEGGARVLQYDSTLSRWVLWGGAGSGSFDGDVGGTFKRSGYITVDLGGGTVDDWAPTGIGTASIIRASSSAGDSIVRGISGGSDGRILTIINWDGADDITFKYNDSNSSAANRLVLDSLADVIVSPGQAITFWYDTTSSLWRAVSPGGSVTASGVIAALDGAAVPAGVVAANDVILFQDADDSSNLKSDTAQGIANFKISELSEDTSPVLSGTLVGSGHDVTGIGVVTLIEQAAAEATVAARGQIWVKTATPNQLWFTDDAGTNSQLDNQAGTGIANIVEDVTPQFGGAVDGQGNDLNNLGVMFLTEQAAAEVDVAGKGQIWVKTATPNQLWFTDDAGTDSQLDNQSGGSGDVVGPASAVDDRIAAFDTTTGKLIKDGGITAAQLVSDSSKLSGIETAADVTDATNVDAAGAVMNSDTSTAAMSFGIDEDNMVSDSATKFPTQQSVKAYVDASSNYNSLSFSATQTLTAGTYSDWNLGSVTEDICVIDTNALFPWLTGISVSQTDGDIVRIHNEETSSGNTGLIIVNQSTQSSAANRFLLQNQTQSLMLGPGETITFVYDGDQTAWKVVSYSGDLSNPRPIELNLTEWNGSEAVSLGDIRIPTTDNDYYYECTTAGTTGGSEPTFGTTEFGTTADNTATWTARRPIYGQHYLAVLTDRAADLAPYETSESHNRMWFTSSPSSTKTLTLDIASAGEINDQAEYILGPRDHVAIGGVQDGGAGEIQIYGDRRKTEKKTLSMVQTVDVTNRSTASTSYVDSSINVTINPVTNGSRIRVTVSGIMGNSGTGLTILTLYRNVNGAGDSDITPSGTGEMTACKDTGGGTPFAFELNDNHGGNTGESVEYIVYFKATSNTAYLGRRGSSTLVDCPTVITAMEYMP